MTRPGPPALLLEAGLVVAWSSGFIGARLAADTPSVFLVLFWRFLVLSALLAPFAIGAFRRSPPRTVALQALIGALAMFGYLASGIKSIALGVPAGTAALICALQPLTTAALAGPLLGETVRTRQWLGLLVGFAGIGLAVGASADDAPFWAYGLCLLGMASLVAATLIAKAESADAAMPLAPALAVQSLISAALFAPLAIADGGLRPPADPGFLAAVAWFVLFSTFGGYGLYWLCLRRSSTVRIGSLIYLTPPVTMLWAWGQFGEPLATTAILGFALCLGGVVLARDRPAAAQRRRMA